MTQETPPRRTPYMPETRRQMADLYEKDATKKKKTRRARRFLHQDYQRIASLYEQGLPSVKIAEKFNYSTAHVLHILHRMGVSVRSPGISYNFSVEDNRRMVEMYQNGRTVQSIADEFGVSVSPITKRLRENGVILRPDAGHPKFSELDRQKMAIMYQNGLSQMKIASQFGCSTTVVISALKEHHVEARSKYPISRFSDEDCNQIVAAYQSGQTQKEIARALGCSRWAIGNILMKRGVNTTDRPVHSRSKFSDEDGDHIVTMYQNGKTQREIALAFSSSHGTIGSVLRKRGIKTKSHSARSKSKFSDKEHQRMVSRTIGKLPKKGVPAVHVKAIDTIQKKNQTSSDKLVRDYWQTDNRAVEMMLLPQETRMQILKQVSDALQYASEILTK